MAAQIHGNTQLEIGWTVGAAVILIFITVFTFIKLGVDQEPEAVAGRRERPAGRDGRRHAARVDRPADAARARR